MAAAVILYLYVWSYLSRQGR